MFLIVITFKFQSMCDLFDFTQLIKEPTRVTADTSSTIDLILTSIPSRMYGTRVIKNTMSDHYLINAVINSQIKAHKLITCRTYKNFVETSFISQLSDAFTDFNIKTDSNIDELWQIFKMKFLSVANTHAPYRSFRAKGSSVPWVTTCIREQYLRMIMYYLDSTDHSEIWLFIKSVLIRKNL